MLIVPMEFSWLDEQPYQPLMEKMRQKASALRQDRASEAVWCCQHPPVYTTGRRAIDNRTQPILPAPLIITDRGGETTFHGPGQLMFYPIVQLKKRQLRARAFVTLLEESCIQLLQQHEVMGKRRERTPGVWSKHGKIAAIGLRIAGGITWHGMALNISTDLEWFDAIRPCGLDSGMDRLSNHTATPPLGQLAQQWFEIFSSLLEKERD